MFLSILEKTDHMLYRLYRELEASNGSQSLVTLCETLGCCQRTLWGRCEEWRRLGNHRLYAIDFKVSRGRVWLMLDRKFNESAFLSYLIQNSISYQALAFIAQHPGCRPKMLAAKLNLSKETIRRRLQKSHPLLARYGVSLTKNKLMLCGEEVQLRLFLFHLKILGNPKVLKGRLKTRYALFCKIGQERRDQGYFVPEDWFKQVKFPWGSHLKKDYVGEEGFEIAWQRIIGLEELRPPISFCTHVRECGLIAWEFHKDQIPVLQDLFRVQLFCRIFKGAPLLLNEYRPINEQVRVFDDYFRKNLYDYPRIALAHPELSLIHQGIVDRYGLERSRKRLVSGD